MAIRIIRIIEYVYATPEAAEEDMARWMHTAPPGNKNMRMRSTILPFEAIEWETVGNEESEGL